MILDIENRDGKILRISYFNKQGEVDYLNLPVDKKDRFIWGKCDKRHPAMEPRIQSWDDFPVRRIQTNRINKYRIEEILADSDPSVTDKIYDFNIPKKYYIDIETEIVDGFPSQHTVTSAVTSISIVNNIDRKNYCLGLKDLTEKEQKEIEDEVNEHFKDIGQKFEFVYIKFDSEYDMLYTFFHKLIQKMPLITGWNFIDYDWTYLRNRARRLKIDPSVASPSGKLIGKNELPQHRLIVDYMEIYKKWDRVVKIKESNRLDYVGQAALGVKKLSYPGTLKELYEKDFKKFILYNAIDTNLVLCIDEKLQTLMTFFKIAYISKIEINRTFSPVWITEALMSRHFKERNKVFVWEDNEKHHVHFAGAYVKEPKKGLHNWVVAYDFASLYPNTMIQWGIDPAAYRGKDLTDADPGWTKTASGAYFDQTTEKPIMKIMLEDFYGKRKVVKKKYLQAQKEIDVLQKMLV